MENDFNFGDQVTFGMYVPQARYQRTNGQGRNSPERHSGVVTGWLNRGRIIVTETRNGYKTDFIFSLRKSGNYILEGTIDVSKKFHSQPLRHEVV
jgi:hypothetical protein